MSDTTERCASCVFWCSFDDVTGICDAVTAPEPLLRIELFKLVRDGDGVGSVWTPAKWRKNERPQLVTPAGFYCASYQRREEG